MICRANKKWLVCRWRNCQKLVFVQCCISSKTSHLICRANQNCLVFRWNRLTLSWRRSLSYRNQSIDLQSKSMDRFLYDRDLRHERVNVLKWTEHFLRTICHALRDLTPFVQFKRREKQPLKSVTFSKIAGFYLQLYLK